MTHPLLAELNEKQRAAVSAPLGHYLILAGAGSGKTRVLVHRIAWLVEEESASPYSILAVTFTNKAANEMRTRIESLLNVPVRGMWVGTFHGIAHRLLRLHYEEAGLPQQFLVLDTDDQVRSVKRIMSELNITDTDFTPKEAVWFINHCKEEGTRAKNVKVHGYSRKEALFLEIYKEYEIACARSGSVDFSELLLRSYELLATNQTIQDLYRQRFSHILIDEFQDTNTIQYRWIQLLSGNTAQVMAVGDDDQAIYGWRGAKVDNIYEFQKQYDAFLIRLEQNYRSTARILAAANALIAENQERMGKELWTDGEDGELIQVYSAFNDIDEARFVANRIRAWHDDGNHYAETAILYRSNAQSRLLEEALMEKGIPYRVYGGTRFYERAEIKDALCYCRLLWQRDDDTAFERVVNMPTRGIGDKAQMAMRELAKTVNISLWAAAKKILAENQLATRAHQSLQAFIELIDNMAEKVSTHDLHELVEITINDSGLWQHYENLRGEKARAKLDNLSELVSAAKQFELNHEVEESNLGTFLSHTALESGEQQASEEQDCTQLMTLHSAKGLEFEKVFITGVEEGLFPHRMSAEDPVRLEEERRLCYVGMTRARVSLTLTYAELRRLHGREEMHRPSRFLRELPKNLLHDIRVKTKVSRPIAETVEIQDTEFYLGQHVAHSLFGDGIIVNYEGSGAKARVQVQFEGGPKWLVVGYAQLQGLD